MARVQLANAPLVKVAAEVRFHGDLSFLASWGSIQTELRDKYPKLYVPKAAFGEAPMLQPFRLATPDDLDYWFFSVNSFGFTAKRYTVFSDFRDRFSFVLDICMKYVRPDRLTRLGLRFVNSLPPAPEEASADGRIHPCLTLMLTGQGDRPGRFWGQPSVSFQEKRELLVLRVALEGGAPSSLHEEAARGVTLDLDCQQTDELVIERVDYFLTEAHNWIDETFFGLLTPEYARYISGETP